MFAVTPAWLLILDASQIYRCACISLVYACSRSSRETPVLASNVSSRLARTSDIFTKAAGDGVGVGDWEIPKQQNAVDKKMIPKILFMFVYTSLTREGSKLFSP